MKVSYEHLLLVLYDSLTKAQAWHAFLELLAKHLQCQSCSLQLSRPAQEDAIIIASHGQSLSPDDVRRMDDSAFHQTPAGQVMTLGKSLSREYCSNKYPPQDNEPLGSQISDLMAVRLALEEFGQCYDFRFARTGDSPPFSDEDIAILESLQPHLNTAVKIYARLIEQQNKIFIVEETASQLGFGYFTLKSNCQILSANSFAESLLKQKSDFFVTQGRLHCSHQESEQKLRRYLAMLKQKEAEEQDCCFQVPCSHDAESSWILMLLRYDEIPPEFDNEDTATYSVIIKQQVSISAELLSELFYFTPAEAQLARQLVRGHSLAEAAEALGRSLYTARVQLSAIFDKTGVRKQHQLISHILLTTNKLSLTRATPIDKQQPA